MHIPRSEATAFLRASDFKGLFLELLGWNRADDSRTLVFEGNTYTLEAFAQQAGVTAYACRVADVTALDYQTRVGIERVAATTFPSHLFVFFDDTWQVWQWSRRELGQPRQLRSVGPFRKTSSFEPILQKLVLLAYDIESGNVQATDVDQRLKDAFNVEPVTKAFYKEFERQYEEFLRAIAGIAREYEREFASLMLNRLMFLYFIQSKGFFPEVQGAGLKKTDYLYGKWKDKATRVGGHSDYLHGFLAPLFFEMLSVKRDDRTSANLKAFGDLIYLNGGLFSQRDWERGKAVAIPDEAFERIFEFFGKWNWQLDERPTRAGNEINPDVLGYVFEKFINQKQMGAYYTKEDITGYISKNTILPFLFEKSGVDARRPLELLQHNVERYIYPAVKHGCDLPLPADIEAGIGNAAARGGWNKAAPSDLALPTEIWREVVARRERFHSLTGAKNGRVFASVSDLITHNLDISQWFSDFVADLTDAGELERLWTALEEVTVLDPTVGSGAFLFAAMNVLQPVYNACLERMEGFVAEADQRASKQAFKAASSFDFFRGVLREIDDPRVHPNRAYAIFKKLTVQNLFGVDIMPEATEICKLRLFLKLAAQVSPDESQPNLGIEPLPDIDFNIRAGNTLVGFATESEVEVASQTQINFGITWEEIRDEMRDYGEALDNFRIGQLSGDTNTKNAKDALNAQHDRLVEKLNLFQAGVYALAPKSQPEQYAAWKQSHHPFHWCAEFYSVIKQGGFDVIIGNPPYVEYSKVKNDYTIRGYETLSCGNLYANVMERALIIQKPKGWNGLIVPLSLVSTERMSALQELTFNGERRNWVSLFDVYPSKLFDGAKQRLTITLSSAGDGSLFSTRYNRWKPKEREALMQVIGFESVTYSEDLRVVAKAGEKIAVAINKKIKQKKVELFRTSTTSPSFYVHRIPYNYVKAVDFVPYFWNEIDGEKKSEDYKPYSLSNDENSKVVLAILNSNLFFFYWYLLFEGYHCGKHEIHTFPFGLDAMTKENKKLLAKLAKELMQDLKSNAFRKSANYEATGKVAYDEFYPSKSKPIIDEIDRVLAAHYGFTDEELDFIINYDIKYRMGRDAGDE